MKSSDQLRSVLVSINRNDDHTEAVLRLEDESRLCFCHRVGQRWAKAVGPENREQEGGMAEQVLAAIRIFRLNRKHLEILFNDGSRWEGLPIQ